MICFWRQVPFIAALLWYGQIGIFAGDYPESWATNLPFDSWVMPGILAITILDSAIS